MNGMALKGGFERLYKTFRKLPLVVRLVRIFSSFLCFPVGYYGIFSTRDNKWSESKDETFHSAWTPGTFKAAEADKDRAPKGGSGSWRMDGPSGREDEVFAG